MIHHSRKLSGLLMAVALCGACSDSAAPEGVSVAGAYTLESINGQPMPFTLVNLLDVYILDQISGTMTLNANRTFVERDSLREFFSDINGPMVRDTLVVITGVWELQDSAIILTAPKSVLFGKATGARLTLHFESSVADSLFTLEYRRN